MQEFRQEFMKLIFFKYTWGISKYGNSALIWVCYADKCSFFAVYNFHVIKTAIFASNFFKLYD